MKEQAIAKINKMGKIGRIICTIIKVLCIIVCSLCLIGAIALTALPKDLFTLKTSDQVTLTYDLGLWANLLNQEVSSEEELLAFQERLLSNASINGNNYQVSDISFEDSKLIINTNTNDSNEMNLFSYSLLLYGFILYFAACITIVFFVGAIFKAIEKCESPFETTVIKKITNLAYAFIPWVIIDSLSTAFIESFTKNPNNLNIELNLGIVVQILIIFGLATIFKYGAILQQESDETL